MSEDALPVLDVFPEPGELRRFKQPQTRRFKGIRTDLVESNSSAAVGIEYRHQKFDGVKVEGYTSLERVSGLSGQRRSGNLRVQSPFTNAFSVKSDGVR